MSPEGLERVVGQLQGEMRMIRDQSARMEEKLDQALARPCPCADSVKDHDDRIKTLEQCKATWKGWLAGAAVKFGLGIGLGVGASDLIRKIKGG